MERTKVAVIGSGPGGYAAAFMAADLGLETTLIGLETDPGGVCLYRGCIPSKALLHAGKLIRDAEEAEAIGIHVGEPEVDLVKLRSWKDGVVRKLTGGLGQLAGRRKIRTVKGRASFAEPGTLRIDGDPGPARRLACEHAIIATGSRPVRPPFMIESPRVMDSSRALELKTVPKRMLVIGGGYIGLEMATVYASLGTELTVVEMLPGLLPGCDRDLAGLVGRRMGKLCKEVLLETTVVSMEEAADGVKVRLDGKGLSEPERVFDTVLVAVGRTPNTAGLGLKNTKVETDPKGFIKTDAQCRTADPAVFAVGDVAGEPMLAHKASAQGRVAAEAVAGKKTAYEPKAVPAVVFTDPEAAWCGLTETRAAEEGREVEAVRFPWAASGRALTLNRTDGLTKLVLEPGTGRVLGAGIAGSGAGELIAEGVLAVEMGARADDLHRSVHPHPTLSESMQEAAAMSAGLATHIYRPKRGPLLKRVED